MNERDAINAHLAAIEKNIAPLKKLYFTAKNRKLEKTLEGYRAGDIKAETYYNLLKQYAEQTGVDIYAYRNIVGYMQLLETEKGLNYTKVAKELQEFVALLKQKLPYNAYRYLLSRTNDFREMDQLYVYLIKMVKEYNLQISGNFPELNHFFDYISASQDINPLNMIKEERNLVRELQVRLAENESEREVAFITDFYRNFEEYFGNKLAADDYEYVSKNLDSFTTLW
jgi:hypothetical protein